VLPVPPPETLTVPPLPEGTAHVPSARKKLVVPPPEALTTPGKVELNNCRFKVVPVMVAAFAFGEEPTAEREDTPELLGVELTQVVPFEVSTFPEEPGDTKVGTLVPLPNKTLFAVSVARPVPPPATAFIPKDNSVPL